MIALLAAKTKVIPIITKIPLKCTQVDLMDFNISSYLSRFFRTQNKSNIILRND
jgi:hypothetical protein